LVSQGAAKHRKIGNQVMRIALITHFFPPQYNAGTENYTLGLARELQARGHVVNVVCAASWDTGSAYWNGTNSDSDTGVRVHRIQLNWKKAHDPNLAIFYSSETEKWLDSFLKSNGPEIVHVTSAMTLGVGALRAAWHARIPLVLTLMDFWFLCARTVLLRTDGNLCNGKTTPWECQQCVLSSSELLRKVQHTGPELIQAAFWNKLSKIPLITRQRVLRGRALDMERRKALMREALELPDVLLAHSSFVQHMFLDADYSDRIRHLPNGHDLGWLEQYDCKTKSPLLRFGFMGQIIEIKGVDTLVKAFKNAKLENKATLDIWGDLSSDELYTERIENLIGKSESIRLRGRFDRTKLAEVLANIDILVVPSNWYENAPLVIYEAFASQTPVVATNLGGMAEAISHGVNGLLFERNNIDDLANQLKRLVEEPDLLAQLQAGISPVKTIQEEVSELEEIYIRLVRQGEKA
jgi:glycosyltransferase involved in cell wall biosynthesis